MRPSAGRRVRPDGIESYVAALVRVPAVGRVRRLAVRADGEVAMDGLGGKAAITSRPRHQVGYGGIWNVASSASIAASASTSPRSQASR